MDEFERTFTELETQFVDPEFKAMLEEVREINQLMYVSPATEEEAQLIVQDLNDKWRGLGYYGKKLHITGVAYMGEVHDDVEHSPLDFVYRSDNIYAKFLNQGFYVRIYPVMTDEGLSVHQELFMRGTLATEDEQGVGGISYESCSVPVGGESLVELRSMTPFKASVWLDTHVPEAKGELDALLLEADGNEALALAALQDIELPRLTGDEAFDRMLKKTLELHLREYITLEEYVPYLVVLDGVVDRFDTQRLEWREGTIKSVDKTLVTLGKVHLEPDYVEQRFKAKLIGNIISPAKTGATRVRISLSAIQSIECGREFYRRSI